MISLASDNSYRCEISAVVLSLHAKNMSTAVVHRELCTVYGQKLVNVV
jgi:hypothetical protein